MSDSEVKNVDLREAKALEIAARFKLTFKDGHWSVPSQSGNNPYRVVLSASAATCTCEDFQLRQQHCKHILAVRLVLERECGGFAPAIDTDAIPKKPTYKQIWPLYNLAQQTEKDRFQVLLSDLCRGIVEPPKVKTGRRRVPMAAQVFASVLKIYTTLSSRRFACDLADAYEQGFLSHHMNSMSICAYLESEAMTPVLQELIVQSSLPLKNVETVFAPDSTGFSVSRFVKWYDEKYGAVRSGRDWVKAHAMTGVKTNIVTAVEILGRDAADCPQFEPLVETTAKNFTIGEVPADKAYLSRDNLEQVEKLGGMAYVPFKSNSAPGDPETLWGKMYHYFAFRKDDFLKHYHQRSNAESTFSMVKAKFGDGIRSRMDVAMKNEALCKFLAHNICVVHQSHIELGIEDVFWRREESADEGLILPLRRGGS